MKRILSLIACALIAVPCLCKETKKEIKKAKEEKEEYGIAFTLKNGYFYPQEKVLRNIFDRKGSKGGYWVEGALRYNFWKGLNIEASGSYFKRSGYALCCPVTCNTNYSTSCCNTTCCNTTGCNTECNTSRCGCECTEVRIPTVGLGLKYFWDCCDWCQLFIGAGLRIFFYREKNSSPYVVPCVSKTTAGGMVNAGIEFDVYKGFFIDLFIDYNFSKLNNCCKACCYPCSSPCSSSCTSCTSFCSTTSCCSYCPSCCFDINLGGVVGGIGLGYKF
jgi:hypothetical protein